MDEKKCYTKKIGDEKENITIKATTWDGKELVKIITPKHPTKEVEEETEDFILGELDDHNAYGEYKRQIQRKVK